MGSAYTARDRRHARLVDGNSHRMNDVALNTLTEDNPFFRMPWRQAGTGIFGKLLHISNSSCQVHIFDKTAGWEETHWAPTTLVVPATAEEYNTQSLDGKEGPRAHRERSAVKSPVQLVHSICNEMVGAERKDIVAACVAQGVNPNTAKTQYYHWRKKQR